MKPHTLLLAACALTSVLLSQDEARSDAKGWEIRGRVVDEAGSAIAGAGLSVGEAGRVTTAGTLEAPQVRTQADGAFTLQLAVDTKDDRAVLLAAKGRLAAQLDPRFLIWRTSPNARVLDFGTIVLPRGITMRGTVRQAGGGPIPGARVTATDALQVLSMSTWIGEGSVQYTAIGITDEKGLVELPGASPDGVRVEVEADGYYVQSLPFVTQVDPLVVELRQGGFVEGQVTDAGGKPCGAFLLVVYETSDDRAQAEWAEDGKFRFNLRHPHRYRIHAHYGADGGLGSLSPVLDGPAKAVAVPSVRAAPIANANAALVVRITEAGSGRAVERVKAAAIWLGGSEIADDHLAWMFETMAVEGRTPGEIRLPGPKEGEPETGIVVIKASGFAPTTIRDVRWLLNQQPDDVGVRGQPILEVKLTRESVISGTVVDDSGRPVEGAAVIADEDDEESPWFAVADANEAGRTSDRDGRFRIGGLAGGKHRLRARVPGRPKPDVIEVEVAASSTVDAVKLVVPRGATVSGRLVGAEAPASAQILLSKRSDRQPRFRPHDDPIAGRRAALESGATFEVTGLDRGDYEVELHVPHRHGRGGWFNLPVEPIRIRRNDLQRDFDISEAVPGRIRGKVTLAGAEVSHRRLAVAACENDEESSRQWAALRVCDLVAADGTFELPVAGGEYRVKLLDLATMVPLHVSAVLRVKPAATIDADLTQTVARVRLRLQPEQPGQAVVASRLEVAVKHDLRGSNRIRIIDDGFPDSRACISLSGGEREIDLLLPTLPTKLRVRSNAAEVLGEGSYSEGEPLVELEVTPDSGKREEIEVRVPAPPAKAKENR